LSISISLANWSMAKLGNK